MNVDSYCERTDAGLWAEPLNAVSNGAFLLAAALLIWLLVGQRRTVPVSVWLLPILLGVVGLCSLSFHTFATTVTGALDSLSILLFILVGVVVVTRWMWGVRWRWAWLAAPGFVLFAVGITAAGSVIGGDGGLLGGYLPALIVLVAFGLGVRFTATPAAARYGSWLLGAAGVFAVSLTLRTLDEPLCAQVPIGTHFLWHCLNAVVLFLISYAVVRRWQDTVRPSARPGP